MNAPAPAVLRPTPRGGDAIPIFVFPFSGGNAATFAPWAKRMPAEVELCPVELPGHGRLRHRPALEDLDALVERLADQLAGERHRPFALFGHSMGALLAFELCRRWSREGGGLPIRLFVSGLPTPRLFDTEGLGLAMAEDRLEAHLERWGVLSARLRENETLWALTLPTLLADLRAVANWRYRPAPPLAIPITALRGEHDPMTPLEAVDPWRSETTAGLRVITFEGGHFYWHHDAEPLFEAIARELLGSR